MQVQTNIPAITAQRALAGSSRELARSLERLSSGLRVNSARDDAAGLAISTRMTTQIRGQSQAVRNANDGISLLQTAEATLSTLNESLQRVRELAVQAANGTNSARDRDALAAEAIQRLAEIDRIARSATFNGDQIFAQNGPSIGGNRNVRAVEDALRMSWLRESEQLVARGYGLKADGAELQIDVTRDSDGGGGYLAFVETSGFTSGGRGTGLRLSLDLANFVPPNLPNGGTAPLYGDRVIAHEMVHAVMARTTNWQSLTTTSSWFVEGAAEFIHGADERLAADIAAAAGATQAARVDAVVDEVASWGGTSADYSAGYVATRYLHDKLKVAGFSGGLRDFMAYLSGPTAPTMDQALANFFGGGYGQAAFLAELQADSGDGRSNGVAFVLDRMNLANADTGAIGGLDADGGAVLTAADVLTNVPIAGGDDVLEGFRENWQRQPKGASTTRVATLQIGANAGETLDVALGAMGIQALGLDEVDLVRDPSRALIHLDEALTYVNAQRATIGGQLARLESTVAGLQTSVEAASASRSRIVDADFAAETAALTRAQILQQAGQAILAQANATPQVALRLLIG